MFTGIVEEIGTIKEFSKGENAFLVVECSKILDDVKIGDSIAIDGVCQTVVKFDKTSFAVQVSTETLNVTTLAKFKTGDKVNLERAMTINGRLGGHIVTGHVDGLGKLVNIQKKSEFYNLKFGVDNDLMRYIAKKGSVTVNGISLTVAELSQNSFEIAIIPHTFENTNLNGLKSGDFVNIEVDILAKYVEKFLSIGHNRTMDEKFLKENGFF